MFFSPLGDWGAEFGPAAKHRSYASICKDFPDNAWCKRYHPPHNDHKHLPSFTVAKLRIPNFWSQIVLLQSFHCSWSKYVVFGRPLGTETYCPDEADLIALSRDPDLAAYYRLVSKPECWELGFRQMSFGNHILYHK